MMSKSLFILICVYFNVIKVNGMADSFVAAVYEHKVKLPDTGRINITRQEAVADMMKNLLVYKEATVKAAEMGASIIVFPEDGIYGPEWYGNRDKIYPYLENIPSPSLDWNPCDDQSKRPESDVQVYLSCLAKNNKLYLVANMGDKKPCNVTYDPGCPPDGRYQFNTDVVYGPNGNLVAKYHKYNLYGELQFNTPASPEIVTFDTPFGKFGVFTCFDIMFEHPSIDLIQRDSVANIVFPTGWIDFEPFFTSIQFHSSFASAHGINFLSANLHLPIEKSYGSGIYTPDGAVSYYYNTAMSSDGKLLVSRIKTMEKPSRVLYNDTSVLVVGIDQPYFKAEIFNDTHNLVELHLTSTNAMICQNNFCCNVTYSFMPSFMDENIAMANDNAFDDVSFFALSAFNGLHIQVKSIYMQICSIVKCKRTLEGQNVCGQLKTTTPGQQIETFHLFGNFSTPYVYPEILLIDDKDVKLTPYPNTWKYDDGHLMVKRPFSIPIAEASMVARVYGRD